MPHSHHRGRASSTRAPAPTWETRRVRAFRRTARSWRSRLRPLASACGTSGTHARHPKPADERRRNASDFGHRRARHRARQGGGTQGRLVGRTDSIGPAGSTEYTRLWRKPEEHLDNRAVYPCFHPIDRQEWYPLQSFSTSGQSATCRHYPRRANLRSALSRLSILGGDRHGR